MELIGFLNVSSRNKVFSTSTYVSYTVAALTKINFHYQESLIKYKGRFFQAMLYGMAVTVVNLPQNIVAGNRFSIRGIEG